MTFISTIGPKSVMKYLLPYIINLEKIPQNLTMEIKFSVITIVYRNASIDYVITLRSK